MKFRKLSIQKSSELIENIENFTAFLDTLKQLIRVPSVIGYEHSFFLYLKRELDELGIKTLYYDGILVAQGNEPNSGMLSAHIDRHGLVCTGPNEFQFAAFQSKNRIDLTGNSVSEQTYQTIASRFINQQVQAYEPWSGSYLGIGQITEVYMNEQINNLMFKIEGLEHLLPGTPVAFVDKLEINDELISAQLDNVISAAIIIYLYQNGYQGTAFFTAQEEAGRSWRFVYDWFKKNQITTSELLVLDTSPYNTRVEAEFQDVVLRNRDANARFKSPLLKLLKNFCHKNNIDFSCKDSFIQEKNKKLSAENLPLLSLGSTELGRIVKESKGSIQGTTLQIPTTGYHTVEETATVKSIKSVLYILKNLLIKNESNV
ncbi:peptidase M42 [Halarcobacter bivalviorum]|uniref:peptidase M42 n=1 Tax=Halarcobacter bivalviorum TaxID=663364 RepID=UPI00100B80D2|nr:peptidase M42 [Halarcobacter bivalviorum]RXK06513.1 peptidase M42 [Halarcobacter bivalviorum]